MSEARRNIADMTLREFLVAAANGTVPMCDLRLVLVPDEETKRRHIEKRIEAGLECECEEHGKPKYYCLEQQVLVCPDLDESNLMVSDYNDPGWADLDDEARAAFESMEGTMPTMILAGFGNFAKILAVADSTVLPMHFMAAGLPYMVMPGGPLEEVCGIEAETIETVDELLRGILGEGEAS